LERIAAADAKEPTTRIVFRRARRGGARGVAALVRAIRARPGDWPALSRFFPAPADAAAPASATEAPMRDLALRGEDARIVTTAPLALGTLAHALARSAPERAARIVGELLERLAWGRRVA
jgi:hypothetical protein